MKAYGGGFFYNPVTQQILLQKRSADAPHHPNIWTIFGGGMEEEDGSDPVTTFIREIKEEMGLDIAREEVIPLTNYFIPSYETQRYVFYVESQVKQDDIEVNEGDGFEWFSFDEAEKLELGPKTREDLKMLKEKLGI